jgi:hypothetical protein
MRLEARLRAVAICVGLALLAARSSADAPNGAAALDPTAAPSAMRLADISGDPAKPRRHFRIRNPARLGPEEAEAIYQSLLPEMAAAYRLAGAEADLGWRLYNAAPYLSATHGQRYVNNYANAIAAGYGRFERAGRLPVGSIVAKDSFAVTVDGDIHPGPLFLMEKMPEDFNYVTGDWRYSMIMPDGSVLGVTGGMNAEAVEFCIACHLMVEHQDHLYFPPRELRTPAVGQP